MAQVTGFPTRLKAPPMTEDINVLRGYIAELANYYAILAKETDFVINGNIDNKNIRANSIEADNIKAGAITAEKIDVDELSAISADLGHITAGLIEAVTIFGSYIATANGTYPRTEMSVANNLFGAYSAAGEGLEIVPDGLGGRAALSFINGGSESGFITSSGLDLLIKANSRLRLDANDDVLMISGGFRGFVFQNFGYIYGSDEGKTLQTVLNDLDSRITALGG